MVASLRHTGKRKGWTENENEAGPRQTRTASGCARGLGNSRIVLCASMRVDHLFAGFNTTSAARADGQVHLQFTERARATLHDFTDLTIGNGGANTDVHGSWTSGEISVLTGQD
jgi:hypothetical protein